MKKGFTLIEVLVTATILSFVLLGVGSVLALAHESSDLTFKTHMKRFQLTNAFDIVKNDVRRGSLIEVASSGLELKIFDSSNKEFSTYSKNRNGDLVRTHNGKTNVLNMKPVKFDWKFEGTSNTSVFIAMKSSCESSTKEESGISGTWEELIVYCRNNIR